MRRFSGQAVRFLHWLVSICLAFVFALALGCAALAWRLAQGPLESPWLTARLEAGLNAQLAPTTLTIGSAALAWEGFRHGLASPLDIRLSDLRITDPQAGNGQVTMPQTRITLALPSLLLGRVQPRTVIIDHPRIELRRDSSGHVSLLLAAPSAPTAPDASPEIAAIFSELAGPPGGTTGGVAGLQELRRVFINQADATITDQQLGVTWRAPNTNIDMTRAPGGGAMARADLLVGMNDAAVHLDITATLPADGNITHVMARMRDIHPAALAAQTPILAPLAALDARIQAEAEFEIGRALTVKELHLNAFADAGSIRLGQGSASIRSATLSLSGTPTDLILNPLRIVFPGSGTGPPTTLLATGRLQTGPAQVQATVSLNLDQLRAADLPLLWPVGLGGDARPWVVANITDGVAHDGHFSLALTAGPGFQGWRLTDASGTLAGEGLTVHWLRPVPPIIGGQATLHLINPDTMEFIIGPARQAPQTPGAATLAIKSGRIRITGLMHKDQDAAVNLDVAGKLPPAIALLSDPRLQLLSRHPLKFREPAGSMDGTLSVTMPLIAPLTMDQVAINARIHLTDVHLGAIAAGQDLNQGMFDLSANDDGLKLQGQALLAGISARVTGALDFRAGPPSQVTETITLTGRTETAQLAQAGLDTMGIVSGPIQFDATYTERRSTRNQLVVQAGLDAAALKIEAIGWRKPPGTPATASFSLALDGDRITAIDPIRLQGDDLLLQGRVALINGHVSSLRADRITLGRTRAQASVNFAPDNGPITATISGSALDLSGLFGGPKQAPAPVHRPRPLPARGPSWSADARFDRVILAHDTALEGVALYAKHDGVAIRDLRLEGFTARAQPVLAVISPDGNGRSLHITAADAGAVLRDLDIATTMDGGRLAITGRYDDTRPWRPLSGTLELDDFRLKDAPVFGKLLEAVTLYGLVDALRGPGIGFNKLIAPFRLEDGLLDLSEARAFSPSLGVTAKGSVDLDARLIDLQGTVVPAYFFNSLLGRMPVIGRLFTSEQGGGLVAGSYALKGNLDDPTVTVNPLTALTPGFLRGLFERR